MPAPRLIHLRRPPVVSLTDESFVPGAAGQEVERRWDALRRANPAYFDGRVLQVLGVHRNGHGGVTLHVSDCAYRYWAVQDDDFDLGVCVLGVKGLTFQDGRVLVGRRASFVAKYAGEWEFAPGGGVEPGRDALDVIRSELREETGLAPTREPIAIALLLDDIVRSWEIVCTLHVTGTGVPETREYDELRWCAIDQLPPELTPIARRMLPLAEAHLSGPPAG